MISIRSFVFSPIAENTYVLYNEQGEACIIDPGCYQRYEQQELAGFIDTNKLKPRLLINTHCHLDHVFGLKWAAEKYGLVPKIHVAEEKMLKLAPSSGLIWGLPFEGYAGPLEFISEKNTIMLGKDELQIIYAPGHSPGHLCFYSPVPGIWQGKKTDAGFLIGGDVLFKNSIGRTDLPGANHRALIESIKNELFVLPDDTIVFPGHNEPTTIGDEKKYNPFLQNW